MKNRYMTPVQSFAFGGIANPYQRAMIRGSDREFLNARQQELDAFEAQRQAYNTALQDWQANVYQPYQQQASAYNTAAQQYNQEVYNPYKTQYDEYIKGIEAYNAGPRTEDYSGPAAPTLARTFDMTAPTTPTDFTMAAPALPFKEEDVQAYQREAAERAREDAGNRAVAIDVVSNPDKFNFGSMSVAGRFMAKGGPVDLEALAQQNAENLSDEAPEETINTNPVGTAQQMLADLSGSDRSSPARLAVKRTRAGSGGGASADKSMQMGMESLSKSDMGAMKDTAPAKAAPESARSQMEELARVYQLRMAAARNKARGLSADTFGAPTLEGPTLTKGKLTKKRFAKGGEAKKPEAAETGERLTPQQIERTAEQEAAEREAASRPAFVSPNMPKATRISRANDPTDRIMGVIEPAVTLGTGAVAAAVGMPRGIYKGLTSGKFKEGKAASIASKEAADFIERNTYVPRSESGKENLAALNKIAEDLKLAPAPGGAAMASLARPTAVRAQGANIADDFQQYNQQISVPGASYAVPPQGPAKTPAPVSNLGFYSAAEQAALNLPRKEGSGAAFLNDLMKGPDVKKEELSAMGLDEFLKNKPKATREEVQDFIANNRLEIKEVQRGGNAVEDPVGIAKRKEIFDKYEPEIAALYKQMDSVAYDQRDLWSELYDKASTLQQTRDREADAAYVIPEPLPTEFNRSPLVLPGGENYREILLTIPTRGQAELDAAQQSAGNLRRQTTDLMAQWKSASELSPGTPETVALYQRVTESRKLMNQAEAAAQSLKDQFKSQTYKSSHFPEPNILAHLRVNDRVDADGKKMLLIEELQSDWHQAGRSQGYKSDMPEVDYDDPAYVAARDRARELLNEFNANNANRTRQDEIYPLLEQAREAEQQFVRMSNKRRAAVPDAPFKETWHQLALKRALKYAADNGYERVGLTTGKQQSQRYNMSTQVDHISYEPTEKGFYINVISKDGPNVLNGDYSAKELEGIVGKELTQKMLAKQGKNEFNPEIEPDLAEVRRLDGVDLQLEDKGMKKYYDEIYPTFLAKQAKKYGAQVGETRIKTGRGVPGGEPVRYIDIAPGMQDAVPYAKGGAVDKNTAFIQAHS
jgi:hypothetical protein